MSQISINTLEQALHSSPYNTELLTLILDHYVNDGNVAGLLKQLNVYESKLDCPAAIKTILAKACSALGQEGAVGDWLVLERDPAQNNVIEFKSPQTHNLQIVKSQVVNFNDVSGLAEVKKQISRRIIAPFLKPSIFQRFKRQSGGGILLYGPPGCGKTLLARATAGECKAHFMNVMLTDILSKWSGESEKNLHAIFEEARAKKPTIIFFDEIEAIASRRQYQENRTGNESLVSLFLTELDGFNQNNEGVLILAATNVPWLLDNAFRRPGRFDRQLFVPPPDFAARMTLLQNVLLDKPQDQKIDIEFIAKHTSGYSGADLKHLVEVAEDEVIDLMLANPTEAFLTDPLLKQALKQVKPSTLEWLAIARNYVEYGNPDGNYDDLKYFLNKYAKNTK